MADGVIPEQLAEQAIPDWLGDEFRLIRERSEQNRMHMPGGDYHRLYWWSWHQRGGNGTEDPVPNKKVRLFHSSRLRGPSQAWSTRGDGGGRVGLKSRRLNGQDPERGVTRRGERSSAGRGREWKARRGAGGMGRGSSCRRLGRDGEMGDGVTANDRLEPASGGLGTNCSARRNLEVMRHVSRDWPGTGQAKRWAGLNERRAERRRDDKSAKGRRRMHHDL